MQICQSGYPDQFFRLITNMIPEILYTNLKIINLLQSRLRIAQPNKWVFDLKLSLKDKSLNFPTTNNKQTRKVNSVYNRMRFKV